MKLENTGIALRSTVFSASEIFAIAGRIDEQGRAIPVFIPEGRSGLESLEVVSSILASTKFLHAGSGVIRVLEHDPLMLTRRLETIQAFSGNRCFLGVGTGGIGTRPGEVVGRMLQRLNELRQLFEKYPNNVEPPEIFVAALKSGIAKRALPTANGLLLNYCSPRYASKLIDTVADKSRNVTFACYLKIFYSSRNEDVAKQLLIQEFLNYNATPQYHEMFVQDGIAEILKKFRENDSWKNQSVELPRELLHISLANPETHELEQYVQSFRQAGIGLPVIYPYFPIDESSMFKQETVKRICEIF